MDIKDFGRVWEAEYIKARVDRILDAVKAGNYESAKDMLKMIQDKARAAVVAIDTSKR